MFYEYSLVQTGTRVPVHSIAEFIELLNCRFLALYDNLAHVKLTYKYCLISLSMSEARGSNCSRTQRSTEFLVCATWPLLSTTRGSFRIRWRSSGTSGFICSSLKASIPFTTRSSRSMKLSGEWGLQGMQSRLIDWSIELAFSPVEVRRER